jgi:cyclopropane-fatty-acyl-phospholipid synthase
MSDAAPARFRRLTALLEAAFKSYQATGRGVPFAIAWKNGEPLRYGEGEPGFTIRVHDEPAVSALASLDATSILEAYMHGGLDFVGEMEAVFSLRDMTSDRHPLRYFWSLARPLLFGQTRADRDGISSHYDHPPEFYLAFMDARHRCYSQAVYERDDEALEDAMTRKLDFALDQIRVKPGDRVLDIGGGWGAFTEHAGRRGIRVTSLTISRESEDYLNALIRRENLPCDVLNRHLYEYTPDAPYDAVVNLGVTEHLPDYGRSIAAYRRLLKPGGRMYLDASACREKYGFHSFIYRHIYPNNCSPAALHEWLTELAKTPFQLKGVWDDRHSYYLTARQWARNLEARRAEIVARHGEVLFRKFQVYLWGTADVFRRDIMQAYRWVIELPG